LLRIALLDTSATLLSALTTIDPTLPVLSAPSSGIALWELSTLKPALTKETPSLLKPSSYPIALVASLVWSVSTVTELLTPALSVIGAHLVEMRSFTTLSCSSAPRERSILFCSVSTNTSAKNVQPAISVIRWLPLM
jgi:hypothetical protein